MERKSNMEMVTFNMRSKARSNSMLLPVLAMCFFTWLVFNVSTMAGPQVPIRNDIVELKFAPVSSVATQLVDLQDQLSTRMAEHRDMMSSNLETFNTTLTNVTDMADISMHHLNFLRNLLVMGSGQSEMKWIDVAALLIDAQAKLRDSNYTLDNDLRLKLKGLIQIAGIMETEMKEMELFMQDISSKVNLLVDSWAKAVHDDSEAGQTDLVPSQTISTADDRPQNSIYRVPFFGGALSYEKPSKSLGTQSLLWSWDVIVDGLVHPTVGEFSQVQKTLIQDFFTHNNVTAPFPTTIPYGIGLPDTLLPEDTGLAPLLFISSEFSTTSTQDSSRYSCDITAYFKEQKANAKQGWLSFFYSCKKHENRMERQLIGVQSVVCWGEAEGTGAKRDIVRERI